MDTPRPLPPPPQTHTLPTWTPMHTVYSMWPHFVLSGQVCTHTHSHTCAHTQVVVVTLHVHTRLVHPCSRARGYTCSRHTSAPTSGRVCAESHTRAWSKAHTSLTAEPQAVASCPLGPAGLLVLGPVHTGALGLPLIVRSVWFLGGMSVSQCSKEDGRSSSGPPHETAAPKRTYDMMEGRVSRAISSASIEGVCPAQLPTPGGTEGPGEGLGPAPGASLLAG